MSGPGMTDAITARLVDARTVLSRAAVDMKQGEAKESVHVALAAVGDALEAHAEMERLTDHLEVLADALSTPGKGSA